jgi:CBS domain-containing protein
MQSALFWGQEPLEVLVDEIMNRNVHAVSPETTVQDAANLMREHRIGAVVVTVGDRVLGMITDRDLAIRVLGAGLPASVSVELVMSGEAVSCAPDDDLKEALRIMRVHNIRRTPVVSEDRLVGVISLCDIATRALEQADVEMTLADLCERNELGTNGELATDEHRQLEERHI